MSAVKKAEKNWFVQSQGKESGPYDYYQIIDKISAGELSTFDFIRALNQDSWGIVSDYEIFQVAALNSIDDSAVVAALAKPNERKHDRKPILADIFVKKSNILYKGRALEVGKGGMGIEAGNDFGDVGCVVNLYCSPISESISFNCQAEIVSKIQFKKNKFRYGIKFLKISAKGQIFVARVIKALSRLAEEEKEKKEGRKS